ncbi:efflux RND transporter permease subunit [Opitutales bacterium ASA1]|uniref:efflux RND transporter permease subunit n=1 Tax=Congregicoccus parvus TaxID=3081749 RepID=UPI002B314982|nr:efflux RND transporter permease subunit [Opitutales bacterium ASA1]
MNDSKHSGLLPRFSVQRPVTVVMILVAILVLGVIAYSRIRIALFPEGLDRKNLMVFVSVPNATPSDVEQNVVRPIEEIVGTIPGVASTWSRASAGNSFVRITFNADVDLDDAYAELRDRMDRVMPEMPDEVERINVRRWDENDIPIIEMAVTLPADAESAQLALEQIVQPGLQRIEGVGNVAIHGLRSKQVIIELNQDRIAAHGIDMGRIMSGLRGEDANMPGGWVLEGDRKFYVRSIGRYSSIDQIGALFVDVERGLRVRDIATVSYREPTQERVYRVDGRQRIGIEIQRTGDGNIVAISDAVAATLAEFREDPALAGMGFEVFFDQGKHVRESIDNLRNSGLWGGLFAAMVLYTFLRAPRMTAIITLAIPLSLLMTVIAIYFMGWSLNMITMMGLLLSIGLVVDNSIVIVENIYRRRQEGTEARRASIEGTGEVGLAVVMATLTTVVVFLPLMLMGTGGEMAFYMLRLGVPVIVSLLASLFIALIFIPLAALKLSRGTRHQDLRIIAWGRERYARTLQLALEHRVPALLVVLLVAASAAFPFKHVQRTDRQGGGDDNVRVFIDMPTGQTLADADTFMTSVESRIMEEKDRYQIARIESRFERANGRLNIVRSRPENTEWYAAVWRSFEEWTGRREARMTRQEVEQDIRRIVQVPPGYVMRNSWRDNAEAQSASSSVSIYGEDTDTLVEISREVERRLASIPEVTEVDTELERGRDELQIRIDRDQARRLGIEPQAVSSGISSTLRGARLSRYQRPDGREVDINVQLENMETTGLDDVRQLTFRNREGQQIPLESVATLEVSRSLGEIRRENRRTTLRVTARAEQQDARRLYQSIDAALADLSLPRGYSWDKGSRFFQMQQNTATGTFALVLAVCFVFFLMGILFESFVLPLAVIISVPFAFLGVGWTLYLTKTPFDMMSTIGVVILVGVVVNNAIVLIDRVNRLRDEGMERTAAVLQAARHRFRPILMTTFTTACGLIPMALGDARMMDMSYTPLGRTMMGGLLTATFMTLVVVPLFYTFLDDFRGFAMRVASSALAPKQPASDSASSGAAAMVDGTSSR